MKLIRCRAEGFLILSFLSLFAEPSRAFVGGIQVFPTGPTSGDRIVAEVRGDFPDSCWSFSGHEVVPSTGEITIAVLAEHTGPPCMDVLVPYSFRAELGELPPGSYRLTVTDDQDSRSIDFEVSPGPVAGDANFDGRLDIGDPLFLLFFIFAGGLAPPCKIQVDGNDDGTIDIADVVYLLEHLFLGGPPPAGRRECLRPEHCVLREWLVFCTGRWECDCGACRAACDQDGCGDGFCDVLGGETPISCPADCEKSPGRPVCTHLGTRSEGWYDSATGTLIEWAFCAGCEAECRLCPTKSEGWYDSCTGELITWADCDCK